MYFLGLELIGLFVIFQIIIFLGGNKNVNLHQKVLIYKCKKYGHKVS